MQKDVIYIDAEDDITAIIGKIKASKEKIIALVPPKRVGVLQSAVNLRLLDRMAKTSKKNLVLITNNQALIALSAAAHIPVAKNLQSKPEVAEIAALSVDDGDDIIDGAELPVGDHAKSSKSTNHNVGDHVALSSKPSRNDAVDTLAIDDEVVDLDIPADDSDRPTRKQPAKSKIKIPNFNSFRKRLVLGVVGVVLFIGLLVWMFVFAPAATVIVTANTTSAPVSATVKLGGTEATDYGKGIVRSVTQELEKNEEIEFDATGTGKVGEKATGEVVFKNCEDTSAITIDEGTTISTNGRNYVTQSSVTVPGGTGNFFGCSAAGTSSAVAVVAADIGDEYNVPDGTSFSVSGHPNSDSVYMRAVASTEVDGGSSREVKVVSEEDIERAKGQLIGKSTDGTKKELIEKFANGEKVIDSSFTVKRDKATSTPAVDAEVPENGKAKLTIKTTYTIYALPKADLESYLNEALKQQIGDDASQRIYKNGIDSVGLSNFINNEQGVTVTVNADGQIGPKIDEAALKDQVKGKITGDVQAALNDIEGISDVNVEYSYFWVRSVPNNPNKIVIEFKLENDEQ